MTDGAKAFWDTHCGDCTHDLHPMNVCSAIVGGDQNGPDYCPCAIDYPALASAYQSTLRQWERELEAEHHRRNAVALPDDGREALREAAEDVLVTLGRVVTDSESQHPGGWGPDVTTVADLRDCQSVLRAALALPDDGREHAEHFDPDCEECAYLARPTRETLALPDDGREGLDVDRGAMAALDLLARSMEFSVGEESYEQNAESIRAAVAMDGLAEAIARQRDSEIDFIPDDERDEFPEHLAALAADVPKTVWKGIGDFLLYGDGKPRERRTTVPGFAPAPDSGSSADKP